MKTELNARLYGNHPYKIVLLHGGPGASGSLSNVANELSSGIGVIEAIQNRDTIEGQLEELLTVIKKDCQSPVQLIGHSWGAWLACLFASAYPDYCNSLTLISCPPFDCQYEDVINRTRMDRLSETDFEKFDELAKILNGEVPGDKNRAFAEIGNIFLRVDSYSITIENPGEICCDYQIYSNVWPQASKMRKTGELLRLLEKIKCPITFIHGEQDPHPLSGFKEPLDKNNITYRLICLKDCGHYPWLEPEIKDRFYRELKRILEENV